MLIAAAVWPAKSDSWGRKKTLTFCLSATAALFGMQALSELSSAAVLAKAFVLHKQWGFSAFLLARFATGLFAGTNPIFKAWQGPCSVWLSARPTWQMWCRLNDCHSTWFFERPLLRQPLFLDLCWVAI